MCEFCNLSLTCKKFQMITSSEQFPKIAFVRQFFFKVLDLECSMFRNRETFYCKLSPEVNISEVKYKDF